MNAQGRTLRAAALLLAYPDDEFFGRLSVVRPAVTSSPGLNRFVDHVDAQSPAQLQSDYVDTFDLRRRCCLYLSYYSYGDTRKRGMALLRFTHAYRAAGYELDPGELPDHLAVVCEFAAAEPESGLRLFHENRAGLELLRMALNDASSPYVDIVDAIRAVLPEPAPRDLERAMALAQSGPPAEEVGLEPFGPPEIHGLDPAGARR